MSSDQPGFQSGVEELIDRPAGGRINDAITVLCGVTLLGAATFTALSYLPDEPLLGSMVFIPFLVAAFLAALWAMLVLFQLSDRQTRRGGNFRLPSGRKAYGELPPRSGLIVAALVLAGAANAASLIRAIQIGQPDFDRTRATYLVHRGTAEVAVSPATYHHVQVLENRGFLGAAFAIVSFFLPIILNLRLRLRRELPSWVDAP